MKSYWKIEVYGENNYGVPEFGLMNYSNVELLTNDAWAEYNSRLEVFALSGLERKIKSEKEE